MACQLLPLLTALACVLSTHAAPQFATRRLSAIAAATGIVVPDSINAGYDDTSTWSFRGRQLHVTTNAFGDVEHIGYRLFPTRAATANKPKAVFNFIERYFLELDLALDKRLPAARLDIDKVTCNNGNIAMRTKISPETPFTIEEIERRMFRVSWVIGSDKLSMTIPADCQLLLGADAVELEEIFWCNIKRAVPLAPDSATSFWTEAKTYRSGNLLIAEGGQYLSKMIRGDIYLTENNGKRRLLIDKHKPVQTAINMLLTGAAERDFPLHLTLNRYGYQSTEADIAYQQLVSLCRQEGCQLFVGVKTHTNTEITATVFALNSHLAYNHVLTVSIPITLIEGKGGTATATAYAYVPLQNVTERFFTNDLK